MVIASHVSAPATEQSLSGAPTINTAYYTTSDEKLQVPPYYLTFTLRYVIIRNMNKEENFLARVREERDLQKRLWPEPHDSSHSWMEWSAILSKYLGRYSDEACSSYNCLDNSGIPDIEEMDASLGVMESSLVKLAAVAMACYEKI